MVWYKWPELEMVNNRSISSIWWIESILHMNGRWYLKYKSDCVGQMKFDVADTVIYIIKYPSNIYLISKDITNPPF